MISQLNNIILNQADRIQYTVADIAPNTESGLINTRSLVIWSGQSNNTVWGDPRVNWAFRALHDALHLKTGLDFSIESEIELGRMQANQYSGLLADLVYIEVAEQAKHYKLTGSFVSDQVSFTISQLKKRGYYVKTI